MLTLTPERLPVTVYRSSDSDAPILDRSPNCVATIFKACLVTGYGDKQPAGWTLPFEDNDKGIKVLRPKVGADTDFYLKLSNDTGREINAQVYTQMSSIDEGQIKLSYATPFKYGIQNKTGENWLLLATSRGFWFFYETANRIAPNQSGTYLFCGDTGKNSTGEKGVFLDYTGGNWSLDDTDRFSMLYQLNQGEYMRNNSSASINPKIYLPSSDTAIEIRYLSLFDGKKQVSKNPLLSPILIKASNDIYPIHSFMASKTGFVSGDTLTYGNKSFIHHAHATREVVSLFIPLETWEF